MTLMIELTADEEARLQEQARLQGRNAASLAQSFVLSGLGVAPAPEEPTVTEAKVADLHRRLLAAGLMTELPTSPLGPPPRPITVIGPPVSQTIIEDRE